MSKNTSALALLDNLIAEVELAVGKDEVQSAPVKSGGNNEKKKNEQPKQPAKTEAKADEELTVNSIELRVGIIRKVTKHETAEKLYCEEIDIGEETPRSIASGLVPYYSLEQMQNRKLIVVCNLKSRNLVGFKSNGMVLCASTTNSDGSSSVEFVDPPANSQPGDRIIGEGLTGEPLSASKCDKLKAFEVIAADLSVDEQGIAQWKGRRLVTQKSGEVLRAPTLKNAPLR
jgi:aminoacyl tRNA synthase complex-interacting multifunctional protein 1